MATPEQLSQIRESLKTELTDENEDLRSQILELRQALQIQIPQGEDNMDILVNNNMRDITSENRPQMSSAGLEINNKHFGDLSNHELHQVKKLHEKDHTNKPRTVLDESLGEIMNKLVNFITFSFDGYSKAVYEAEVMEDVYDDKSIYQSIKIHVMAIILFMRDDQNILYIGILLVFFSMILYLMNITTS